MSQQGRHGSWWWIDRWRRSSAFIDFTLAQQGAYRNLIDELWLRGGVLPNDERVLARASGDPIEWPDMRDKVLSKFTLTAEGWRHGTVDEVMAGSRSVAGARSEAGKKGAASAQRGPGGKFTVKTVKTTVNPTVKGTDKPTDKTPSSVSVSVSVAVEPKPEPTDKRTSSLRSGVSEVFAYWQTVMEHPDSRLTDERRRKVEGRLREGATVEEIKAAIDGCRASAFHMGENDAGKRHDDLTLICRSGAKLDWFRQKAVPTNGAPKVTDKAQKALDRMFILATGRLPNAGEREGVDGGNGQAGTLALPGGDGGANGIAGPGVPGGSATVPDRPRVEVRRE